MSATSAGFSGLSTLAKVGMGVLVVGLLVVLSGCLNLVGLEIKGLSLLDSVFGESPVIKLVVGIPVLLVGGVVFRLGGGKEHFDKQKRG